MQKPVLIILQMNLNLKLLSLHDEYGAFWNFTWDFFAGVSTYNLLSGK